MNKIDEAINDAAKSVDRTVPSVAREQWEWFGHPAHLIVGRDCIFHLATKVGEYLISTVGEYWPERSVREIHAQVHDSQWLQENHHLRGDDFDHAYLKRFGYENVGCDRKYETYVFRAGPPCTAEDCHCGLPIPTDYSEIDSLPANDAGTARQNHMTLCEKWASR